MKKNRASALLSLCALICAEDTGFAATPPGAGTEADPYRISQLDHLVWMGDTVASSAGKYYKLQNDIDASVTTNWNSGEGFAPIGSESMSFGGVFDGDGKVIGNLTINRPTQDYVGLFGSLGSSSVVRNLGLLGGAVTGNVAVGGLAGATAGIVSNCYATGSATGRGAVGGLAGATAGTVSDCHATGLVTGEDNVGGLVGAFQGTASRCYATGSATGMNGVGGLAGQSFGGTVDNCHAMGAVTGTRQFAGGLLGYSNCSAITNCYAAGSVVGVALVGGLVGGVITAQRIVPTQRVR